MSRISKLFLNKRIRRTGTIALTLALMAGCGANDSNNVKTVNGVQQGVFNPGAAPALPYGGPPDLSGANQAALKAVMGSYTGTLTVNGKICHYQMALSLVNNPVPAQQSQYYGQTVSTAAYLTLASADAPVPFTVKSWVEYGWSGNYGTISVSSLSVLVPGLSTDPDYPLYVSVQLQLAVNSQNQIDPSSSMIDFMDCGSSGIVCNTSVEYGLLDNIVVNQDLRKVQ